MEKVNSDTTDIQEFVFHSWCLFQTKTKIQIQLYCRFNECDFKRRLHVYDIKIPTKFDL